VKTRGFLYSGFFLVFCLGVALIYVKLEQPIYIWDFKGYWIMFMDWGKQFLESPVHGLKALLEGIRANDYNPLPAVLLFPFYCLFGGGRSAYISALVLLYLYPVALMTLYLFNRLVPGELRERSAVSGPAFFAAAFLFIPFWGPTLRGLPDIIGMMPVILAFLLVFSADFTRKPVYRQAVILGFLLWAPFLLRRWYAYTIVSLYLTLPGFNYFLHQSRHDPVDRLGALKNLAANFFIAGITSVAGALVFQGALIKRILKTDYSHIYSAYHGISGYSLWGLCVYNGLLTLVFIGWGLWFCLTHARRTLVIASFICANLVISFFLFTRTQTPGIHHLIPFSFWILLLFLFGLYGIRSSLRKSGYQTLFDFLFSIGIGLVFLTSLFGGMLSFSGNFLLPAHCHPQRLKHIGNYYEMVGVLERLTANGEKFSVISSSKNLTGDLISTLSGRKLDSRLVHSSQVDLRDKIFLPTFTTRYLLLADPVQVHLAPEGQRVITIPASLILDGRLIGQAYRKLDYDFLLDEDVHAYVYEKIRPFTREEVAGFLQLFYRFYPEWQAEYENSLEVSLLSASISLGDVWGRFSWAGRNVIYAHPGQTRPTIAELDYPFDTMQIVSLCQDSQTGDGVVITIEQEGEKPLTRRIGKGESVKLDVSCFGRRRIRITIDKNRTPDYDSIFIRPN